MKNYSLVGLVCLALTACQSESSESEKSNEQQASVRLMTLDPGHFHAGLVQKFMYDAVDPVVHVYAPEGPDVQDHLKRIAGYNERADDPTRWEEVVYTGPDYLQKMLTEKPGNVMVVAGKNSQKTKYIKAAVDAGINVLADKPMVIKPDDFELLKAAFASAEEHGVLLYDIMTERYEITTIMQKELSRIAGVFGSQEMGTPEAPAITKESVHHFFKYVSGSPLQRPGWFFDIDEQGEAVVDVSTHLVDLVFWECFPEQTLDYKEDIEVISARRWSTELTPSQFTRVTGLEAYPDYLQKDIIKDSILNVFSNGEIIFKVNGVHAKVSVIWNYEAPEGAKDTHYSIMRGTTANLVIRQGAEQNYLPTLYVEPVGETPANFESTLTQALKQQLAEKHPGLDLKASENGWEVIIPEEYKVGHEAHFTQVMKKFLEYLEKGGLPEWEVPNMIAKYYVTTEGYKLSR
ncbi:MAG: putative oxidoreductase C-terminal domain-containing protein [Saprospiraceae bacterium]